MWESFNQLPIWLKAIVLIVPAGVLAGIGIALFIKILKSEKVAIGKNGLQLDDIEEKVDTVIDNQKTIIDEVKK